MWIARRSERAGDRGDVIVPAGSGSVKTGESKCALVGAAGEAPALPAGHFTIGRRWLDVLSGQAGLAGVAQARGDAVDAEENGIVQCLGFGIIGRAQTM